MGVKHLFWGTGWRFSHPLNRNFAFSRCPAHLCTQKHSNPWQRSSLSNPIHQDIPHCREISSQFQKINPGDKKKNLLIQGMSIQKREAHLVQGWKSYFIFMSKEGAITQGRKRRKKSCPGQGHSVADLDSSQRKPKCNKNENKQPWGGSADAWKSTRKRKGIIRSSIFSTPTSLTWNSSRKKKKIK